MKEKGDPMADMYEAVRNNEGKRRPAKDKKVLITVIVVGMFFIGMVFSFWWYMSYWKRYANLSSELSAATLYAYDNDCAYAETGSDGGTLRYKLKRGNIYDIYQCVCVYGPGRERFREPDGDGVEIDYGNGAKLKLVWDGKRLYFCFRGAEGFNHIFYTKEIDLDYLMMRYLAPEKQG